MPDATVVSEKRKRAIVLVVESQFQDIELEDYARRLAFQTRQNLTPDDSVGFGVTNVPPELDRDEHEPDEPDAPATPDMASPNVLGPEGESCDGEHPPPACADAECWHRVGP